MNKKIFTLLIGASLMSVSAFSQTIKDNIDKAAKDKNTRDMADKADVLIHKKSIADSAVKTSANTSKHVTATAPKKQVKKVKYKSKKYKRKRKTSSK